jgi:demethylmenaquinone methyltransferase / 2-methoxy-6-polyprenyl-1,4-benzoquinol methylase
VCTTEGVAVVEPIEPHPVIAKFYEERAQRLPFVRDLFNRTAPHYDVINQVFSLGSGGRYRRRCLLRSGLRPGLRLIDVAIGTGLLAREAVSIIGSRRHVIGVDLSEGMLAIARAKLGISLIQGTADALPLADEITDFVTMGYALRHVSDLNATFHEFHRVLRRGGTALILEIGKPNKQLNRVLASTYLGRVIPFLCRWAPGQGQARDLMQYYWATIENSVPAEIVLQAMHDTGFYDVMYKVQFDLFRSYIGRKR